MNATTASLTEQNEQDLWQQFVSESDAGARQQLINHYLELARLIAAKLFLHRPDNLVEFDDYYQFAVVGLIESVDRYNPGGKSCFATYASFRIRGAILNGIEKASESREQIAFKQRLRRQRVESLTQSENDDGDINLFEQMIALTTGLALGYILSDSALTNEAKSNNTHDLSSNYGMEQIGVRLQDMIAQLPERDRMIINYHYFHHISFEDISRIFNVSKGRISQLHKRSLQTLRKSLPGNEQIDSYF